MIISLKYQQLLSRKRVFFTVLIFVFFAFLSSAQAIATRDSTKSIIIKTNDLTPLDLLRGDTNKVKSNLEKYDAMPGAVGKATLPYQDTNYIRALRLHIPNSVRLDIDLRRFSALIPGKSDFTVKEDMANNALNLPAEYYMPRSVDIANYQYNLLMSQNNVTGIKPIQPFGFKMSFGQIGRLLGLVEDVSPVITYEIDYRTQVQVVIYSINAIVVATLFDGIQSPGKYTYTWNGRNDAGMRLPPGDYIGEVRIGKQRYIRKHILIKR